MRRLLSAGVLSAVAGAFMLTAEPTVHLPHTQSFAPGSASLSLPLMPMLSRQLPYPEVDREQAMRERDPWQTVADQVAALDTRTRIAVQVVDLQSGEVVYSHRQHEIFTPASLYKLFVVQSILSRVESGDLSAHSAIGWWPVQACVEDAIIYSDDECSEWWLDTIGRETLNAEATAAGAPHTVFPFGELETTASDIASFLAKLYRGELLDRAHTALMIDLMKSQVWRDGMPAALEPEHTVASKVGFLDEIRNEAGIVYTSRGDYVVVVLTESSDWALIEQVSQAIGSAL